MALRRLFLVMCLMLTGVRAFAQENAELCADAPPPRLEIGAQGTITPGDSNNLRNQPTRSGTLLGVIPSGDVFEVVDGPTCADELNWWQVEYDGQIGWTAEGSGFDYFLSPLDTPQTGESEFTEDEEFRVNSTDITSDGVCGENHCTLLEAINQANLDPEVTFLELGIETIYVLTRVYVEDDSGKNGLPPITTSVVISGYPATVSRYSESPEFRILYVSPEGSLTTHGLIIYGGYAENGGGIRSDGPLFFNGGFIVGNTAVGGGGGVYSTNQVNIIDSMIDSNTAETDAGGGIQVNGEGYTAAIVNTTLTENTGSGGAISVRRGDALLERSTVVYNISNGVGGGGIENQSLYGSTMRLENTIITYNEPVNCTGAIANISGNIQYPESTCGDRITVRDPHLGELYGNPPAFMVADGITAGSVPLFPDATPPSP